MLYAADADVYAYAMHDAADADAITPLLPLRCFQALDISLVAFFFIHVFHYAARHIKD